MLTTGLATHVLSARAMHVSRTCILSASDARAWRTKRVLVVRCLFVNVLARLLLRLGSYLSWGAGEGLRFGQLLQRECLITTD